MTAFRRSRGRRSSCAFGAVQDDRRSTSASAVEFGAEAGEQASAESWIVVSDVPHRIDELLRKAGIDLPQRDVHLETNKPLEVHVRRE